MTIKFYPTFAYAYDNRGFCKYKIGKLDAALKDINYALELDASNSYAYKYLGLIYSEIGDKAKAIEYLQIAKDLGYSEKYDNEVDELLESISLNNPN